MIEYIHKDLYWQDSIDKQLKIELEDGTILDNSMIYSEEFELEESLCSDDELRFGACEASCVKFRIFAIPNRLVGQKITISEVVSGQTDNPMQIGKYKIASAKPTADRDFIDIVAYDGMYDIIHADVAAWYNNQFKATTTTTTDEDGNETTVVTYSTTTLKKFRDSFFSHFGIEQVDVTLPNDGMVVSKTIEIVPNEDGTIGETLSGSTAIEAICELNGCFGHINRNGKFEYVTLQVIAKELFPANDLFPRNDLYPAGDNVGVVIYNWQYEATEYEDFDVQPITQVQIIQEDNDIGMTVGADGNNYVVNSNFLTYSLSDAELETVGTNILSVVKKAKYTPIKANVIGNPCVTVGDIIKIVTNSAVLYSYVINRTLKGCQSLTDEFESNGEEYRSVDVNSTSGQIKKLQGRSNVLERSIDETRSTIANVEKGLKSEIKQTADSIESTVAQSTKQWDTTSVSISEYGFGFSGTLSGGDIYIYSDVIGEGGIYLDQKTGYGWKCKGTSTLNGKRIALFGYRPSYTFSRITDNLSSEIKQTANSIESKVAQSQSKWDASNFPVPHATITNGYGKPSGKIDGYNGYLDVSTGMEYYWGGENWIAVGKATEIKTDLETKIEQTSEKITASVSASLENYSTKSDVKSAIEISKNGIESTVAKNVKEWDFYVDGNSISIDEAGYGGVLYGKVNDTFTHFWYSEKASLNSTYLNQINGMVWYCDGLGEFEGKKVATTKKYVQLEKKTESLSTEIKQTAESIAISVSEDGDIITSLTTDKNGVSFVGDKFVVDSKNFTLDENGNATFSGVVKSSNSYSEATLSNSRLDFESLVGTGGGAILIGAVGVEDTKVKYGFGVTSDDGIYIGTEDKGNFDWVYRVNTSSDDVYMTSSATENWGTTNAMHLFKEDAFFSNQVYVYDILKLYEGIEFWTYESISKGKMSVKADGTVQIEDELSVLDSIYAEKLYVGDNEIILKDGKVSSDSLFVQNDAEIRGDAEIQGGLDTYGEIRARSGLRFGLGGNLFRFYWDGNNAHLVVDETADLTLATK